jgi:hypothetical protein
MVFNATLSNISVISWQSVLLVGETRVHGENNRPVLHTHFSPYSFFPPEKMRRGKNEYVTPV